MAPLYAARKKFSTGCKAHWDIREMRYIRTPIIIIIIIKYDITNRISMHLLTSFAFMYSVA
jgi:hypothetical protein